MAVRRTGRPMMPEGYGVVESGPMLDWEAVEARLVESIHYWLSTTRPDGRPHVVPRWGVWIDEQLFYDGSPETRHARNLGINAHCVLHLEDGDAATIVEGTSAVPAPVTGELGNRMSNEYKRKYQKLGYAPGPDAWSGEGAGGLHVLAPTSALAWSQFPRDVTRFEFD
ncbi:MAG TPA: pyridoxamine 5'-phosphate oxidase family protein [Acidimicrobiia bacterium]